VNTEDDLFLKKKKRREGGMKKKSWRPLKEKQGERR